MDDFERASAFQPTLPLRGATLSRPGRRPSTSRFNPRSPCGERPMPSNFEITAELSFQPTLPLRGATAPMPLIAVCNPFQPTLPLRGATATSS